MRAAHDDDEENVYKHDKTERRSGRMGDLTKGRIDIFRLDAIRR